MAAATITAVDTSLVPLLEIVRLTTASTSTDTYQSKRFSKVVAAWINNESDNDACSVAISGSIATIKVGNAGDVVTLMLAGRK